MKIVLASFCFFSMMAAAQASDKSTYNSMKGAELHLDFYVDGSPLVGVSVSEKSDSSTICQKTGAVVLHPTYTYACYSLLKTNSAEAIYNALAGEENLLSFSTNSGDQLIGSSTTQKSDGDIFCRKTGAVVPNPVYSYSCYAR
jgi:hypothetical protein